MSVETRARNVTVVVSVMLLSVLILATAAAAGETFTATATVKTPTASASSSVTIQIDRFLTDAERERIVAVVKRNDATATRAALKAMDDLGFIELGSRRTPIKYAYARPAGSGRLVTVVTAEPILHLGSAAPEAKPKAGFDLALALLVLDGSDTGTGEFAPAVRVKATDAGAIETDEYASEVVRLTGVKKSK